MKKFVTIVALSLLTITSGCSTVAKTPPIGYVVLPTHLLMQCIVKDISIKTVGDIEDSRAIYKEGFEKCAAQVDAIRDFDGKARRVVR